MRSVSRRNRIAGVLASRHIGRDARFCLAVVSIALCDVPVLAQSPALPSLQAQITDTTTPFGAMRGGVYGERSDLAFGQNIRGPYRLSWKLFRPFSERIRLNGRLLFREVDYTIDESAGILTFANVIKESDMIEATYRIDNGQAQPNRETPKTPLRWNLAQMGENRISALVRPDSLAQGGSLGGASYLEFIGGMKLNSASKVSTGVFVDMRGGDWLERSGLRVTENTRLKNATVGFSYSRAGADFQQQDLTNLIAGRETLETSGVFTPSKGLTFTSIFRQTSQLLDTKNPKLGATSTQEIANSISQSLPKNAGKFTAAKTETETTTPDGKKSVTGIESAQIEGVLSKNAQATLGFEARTLQSDSSVTRYLQTANVGLRSTPFRGISLTGDYRNQLGTDGVSDIAGIRLEANVLANLRLRAGWEDRYQAGGATRSRDFMADLPVLPFAKTRISGGVRYIDAPTGERLAGILSGSLAPASFLELSGASYWRSGSLAGDIPDPNYQDGYQLDFRLKPTRAFSLFGSMGRNPEEGSLAMRSVEAQKFGLETSLGRLSLKGQIGAEEEYLQSRLARTADFGLSWRLSRWDSLTTSYQARSLVDGTQNNAYTYLLTYSRNLNSIFRFSLRGSLTLYEQNRLAQPDRTEYRGEAQLGIRF